MGPAKNNLDALAEFGGRKAPKPQKTRKFHFFFFNTPPFWALPAEKGYCLTELPNVLSLFLTFSRKKKMQLDAAPVHFIYLSIFSKLSGIWRGINAHRRCPALQGGRARQGRFRGNLG